MDNTPPDDYPRDRLDQRDPTDTGEQYDPTQTGLQRLLQRGAEPFWMQDVRLALRRLEALRE